jgi:ABC-type ATPase with predicted acetyltransferase domain
LLDEALRGKGVNVLRSAARSSADEGCIDDRPIIERIGETLEGGLAILSRAGLSDAFVMLRRASELSDGQRARFEMARLIEAAAKFAKAGKCVAILIDEFAATLDRIMARTIARNLRKWITGCGDAGLKICLIIATTHDDLLEPLHADVLVWKGLGDEIKVVQRGERAETMTEATSE